VDMLASRRGRQMVQILARSSFCLMALRNIGILRRYSV
jgi:hypothetical protein